MSRKIKELSELLGVASNSYYEAYNKNYQILQQGVGFDFYLNYNVINKDTLLASFFNQNIFDLYLMDIKELSNINSENNNDARLSEIVLFKDEEYSFKFWNKKTNSLEMSFNLILKDMGEPYLSKIFSKQSELVYYEQNSFFGEIKLIKKSDENRDKIKTHINIDKFVSIVNNIKKNIIYRYSSLIGYKDPHHDLPLLIHRLQLWGYDYSSFDYENKEFQSILEGIVLTDLGFKDVIQLEYFTAHFFDKISNDDLIMDVENFGKTVRRKIQKHKRKYLKSQQTIRKLAII